MTFPMRPICVDCIRLHAFDPDRPGFRCDAFPDGIPQAIVTSELDHHHPVDGDHGLRFLAKSLKAQADAAHIIAVIRQHPGGTDPWQLHGNDANE